MYVQKICTTNLITLVVVDWMASPPLRTRAVTPPYEPRLNHRAQNGKETSHFHLEVGDLGFDLLLLALPPAPLWAMARRPAREAI